MTAFKSALLLEDEPNLALALELSLRRLGVETLHHVTTLAAASELWAVLTKEGRTPELALLDRMLPDGDGLSFCRELRRRGYAGRILVLTASGHVEAKVEGLDAGADDYIPKPFSWEELEARVRALARRASPPTPAAGAPREDEPWAVDESNLRIRGPRGWVEMTPLEFKLVRKLVESGGRIVSRDELLTDVWGFKWLPRTRTVDYFMGRVRKNFEADPERPRHFLTVRGVGYRFDPKPD